MQTTLLAGKFIAPPWLNAVNAINGPAAVGDLIVIALFGQLPVDQLAVFQPKLVLVDGTNRIKEARTSIPVPGQQQIQHVYRFKEQHHVQRF